MKARHWVFLAFAALAVGVNENVSMSDPRGYTLGCRLGIPLVVLMFQGAILLAIALVVRRPRSWGWHKTLGLFSWLFLILAAMTSLNALVAWRLKASIQSLQKQGVLSSRDAPNAFIQQIASILDPNEITVTPAPDTPRPDR